MKTVVVVIEKSFVCTVPVSVPDWWDDATAMGRLGTPEALAELDAAADPADWEEANEEPAVRWVSAPGGPVTPVLYYDDGAPASCGDPQP